MNRQQAFEAIYAKQHDVPAESLVQYRFESKEGYSLPMIASHYRTYLEALDSEEIQGLRKDAGRYRWLRNEMNDVAITFGVHSWEDLSGEFMDSAIDGAMTKGDKP